MMTTGQQQLKAKVYSKLATLLDDDEAAELVSTEIGVIPDHFSELMAEAAFNVLMTIKDTNDYRDDNPA